jgi:hypothetical protein
MINTDTDEVYSYDFQTNTTTLLNPYFDTPLPLTSDDIAHTNNKLWLYDGTFIYDYNITLSPFSGVFNRQYSITGLGPGLCAKDNTTLISSVGNTIGEITLGISAVFSTQFTLPTNRAITGDIILTTNNKLITSNYDIATFAEYITQQDYATGTIEVDIPLTGTLEVYGLFIYNGNIYFTTDIGDVYLIDKNSPYNVTFQTNNRLNNFGASQIPSCCDVSFS